MYDHTSLTVKRMTRDLKQLGCHRLSVNKSLEILFEDKEQNKERLTGMLHYGSITMQLACLDSQTLPLRTISSALILLNVHPLFYRRRSRFEI